MHDGFSNFSSFVRNVQDNRAFNREEVANDNKVSSSSYSVWSRNHDDGRFAAVVAAMQHNTDSDDSALWAFEESSNDV